MRNRQRALTIKDVAAHAAVSIKTVSRVLNAEPHVTAELQERVLASIAALDFKPNAAARSLPGSKSYLIAVLLDDPASGYASAVQTGAISRCRERGFHLVTEKLSLDSEALQAEVTSLARALRLDGAIVIPPACDDQRTLKGLEDAGTAYVRLSPDDQGAGSSLVYIDDRAAAAAMVESLVAFGHRRIGFIEGDRAHGASHRRKDGYLDVVSRFGGPLDLIEPGDFSFRAGLLATERLLARGAPPTAIFASNDDMALGALAAAGAAGVPVPTHLSIAGFDDSPGARLVWPQLSTVRQPNSDMAATAVDILIQQASSKAKPAEIERTLMDFKVVLRGTTAPAP